MLPSGCPSCSGGFTGGAGRSWKVLSGLLEVKEVPEGSGWYTGGVGGAGGSWVLWASMVLVGRVFLREWEGRNL